MKRIFIIMLVLAFAALTAAGCAAQPTAVPEEPVQEEPVQEEPVQEEPVQEEPVQEEPATLAETEIQVFVAASLENAIKELIPMYNAAEPNVTVTYNADSSGTLLTQVQEGYECDIFFSAAVSQVKTLEEEGFMIEGSRADLLMNKVALITWKGSGTSVTGFDNIKEAKDMALADGSVPVGRYTRQLLVNLGYIPEQADTDALKAVTSAEISDALGVEINECGNVSKVKEAVKEGANEIGTVYYSDAYSVKEYVDILEIADASLTGDILYPVCRVANALADDAQTAAADSFIEFLKSPEALAVFENYMFIINK